MKLHRWGVLNTKTNKMVRECNTRESARNRAKHASHYVVVRRIIKYGKWKKPLEVNPKADNDKYAKYF